MKKVLLLSILVLSVVSIPARADSVYFQLTNPAFGQQGFTGGFTQEVYGPTYTYAYVGFNNNIFNPANGVFTGFGLIAVNQVVATGATAVFEGTMSHVSIVSQVITAQFTGIELAGTGTLQNYGHVSGLFTENLGTGAISLTGSTALRTSPVPEPTSLLMFGTGIIGIAGVIRRKVMGEKPAMSRG